MELLTTDSWARFAATNALDLISLVLSADPNKRAPTSFSHTFREAGLNQGIPFGSMGISRENHEYRDIKPDEKGRTAELQKRQELVSKAARMEALDSATDEILKAARNLEKEVRRETKYWQEIVSISDKGWPIQRLRQNARHVPFGVRYGLPEGTLLKCEDELQLIIMQLAITLKLVASLPCAWTKTAVSFSTQTSR